MSDRDGCRYGMPAIGCGTSEGFVLAVLFLLLAILSIFASVRTIARRNRDGIWGHCLAFWLTMTIWSLFRCVIATVPFDFSLLGIAVMRAVVNSQLFLLPLSTGLLTFYRCLSLYQIQRGRRFVFARTMFVVFLGVYLIISVVVTAANRSDPSELVRSMGIWLAATDSLILIFALFGSFKTFRTLMPRPTKLTMFLDAGVVFFIFLYLVRVMLSALLAVGMNPIIEYIKGQGITPGSRAVNLLAALFGEAFIAAMMCGGIAVLQWKEDQIIAFVRDRRHGSDTAVIDWPLTAR
jgi:hypothetical protein